ncbi:hypothetical protein H5410_061814 [Solanum commersonii]|uniref:Uncharacterized protein n=1 Tax=Solanum commersonii TaxID=4109 RepID=A0A9J5WAB9_SOLCO|nr:hypothetical protein H5410_061814 [Solanum commersonii]
MIIERETLRNRLETLEEREAILRNNLALSASVGGVNSYVIRDHHHLDDTSIFEKACSINPHLSKVLENLYEIFVGQ